METTMQPTKTPRDPAQPYLIRATLALIAVYALIVIGSPETSDLAIRMLGITIDACVLVAICDLPTRYRPVAYAYYRVARHLIRTLFRKSPVSHGLIDRPKLSSPFA
ncbi:hypothetical protein MKK65_10830 [Methylobacterium sp. J-001]|uniref:hypothetical protein n=1 Tax=Methylobacterium sp. J-001 TaxID=2836609 RepID=UPI001FBB8FB4|nr:hypothetical protein [Methylobacterium sp. J-001]MCJ2117055.1 hypothetical protein [Methylobacterium sp. J-001]